MFVLNSSIVLDQRGDMYNMQHRDRGSGSEATKQTRSSIGDRSVSHCIASHHHHPSTPECGKASRTVLGWNEVIRRRMGGSRFWVIPVRGSGRGESKQQSSVKNQHHQNNVRIGVGVLIASLMTAGYASGLTCWRKGSIQFSSIISAISAPFGLNPSDS